MSTSNNNYYENMVFGHNSSERKEKMRQRLARRALQRFGSFRYRQYTHTLRAGSLLERGGRGRKKLVKCITVSSCHERSGEAEEKKGEREKNVINMVTKVNLTMYMYVNGGAFQSTLHLVPLVFEHRISIPYSAERKSLHTLDC